MSRLQRVINTIGSAWIESNKSAKKSADIKKGRSVKNCLEEAVEGVFRRAVEEFNQEQNAGNQRNVLALRRQASEGLLLVASDHLTCLGSRSAGGVIYL